MQEINSWQAIEMREALEKLQSGSDELVSYVGLLKKLEAGKSGEPLGNMQKAILLANVYLIAYNLVEAVARETISGIYSHLKREDIVFSDLTREFQRRYLLDWNNAFLGSNIAKYEPLWEASTRLPDLERDIIDLIPEDSMPFSGNVDAKKLRDATAIFGIVIAKNESCRNGADLLEIKEMRNSLAHGDLSFHDVGRDQLVSDLEEKCNRTIEYLGHLVKTVGAFLDEERYMRIPKGSYLRA